MESWPRQELPTIPMRGQETHQERAMLDQAVPTIPMRGQEQFDPQPSIAKN